MPSGGFFLRPVLQLHTYKTCSLALKAEPLLQELSPHFQKSHIIECFFNMVAVSKHLGTAFRSMPVPTVGSGWSKKKKQKKTTSQVKFKGFFWKPCRAAINQGRHFHAPHFSWFLSEFPPFLSPSTLAPLLPTAALAADHDQQGIMGWPSTLESLGEKGSPSSRRSAAWPWMAPTMEDSPSGQQDFKFLSPPFTNNAQPEKSERMANSNQSGASSPPTYRPGFNVAMKETFYCRLQTAVLSQLCVVYAIICEGRRGLVLIRAVKWQRSGRLLTSVEAKFIERCTKRGWGWVTADLWSPAETQTQKGGCEKHFYFTWPVIDSRFSLGSLQTLAACKPTVGSVQASNPLDVLRACK